MRRVALIALLLALIPPVAGYGKEAEISLDAETLRKGREVFISACATCHGLKYDREGPERKGVAPLMEPRAAEEAFGVVPPDLTLMAIARGKGREGARYIYDLLTGYYLDEKSGEMRNRAFAQWTHGTGAIAMPPPFALDDPLIEEKSAQVSAFLLHAAMPERKERMRTGAYAIAYTALLTALLFALNRVTWRKIKKKGRGAS